MFDTQIFGTVGQWGSILVSGTALVYTFLAAGRQKRRDRREHVASVFIRAQRHKGEDKSENAWMLDVFNSSNYPIFTVKTALRAKRTRMFFATKTTIEAVELKPGASANVGLTSTFVGFDETRMFGFIQDAWGQWWTRPIDRARPWRKVRAGAVPSEGIDLDKLPPRLRARHREYAEVEHKKNQAALDSITRQIENKDPSN